MVVSTSVGHLQHLFYKKKVLIFMHTPRWQKGSFFFLKDKKQMVLKVSHVPQLIHYVVRAGVLERKRVSLKRDCRLLENTEKYYQRLTHPSLVLQPRGRHGSLSRPLGSAHLWLIKPIPRERSHNEKFHPALANGLSSRFAIFCTAINVFKITVPSWSTNHSEGSLHMFSWNEWDLHKGTVVLKGKYVGGNKYCRDLSKTEKQLFFSFVTLNPPLPPQSNRFAKKF